MNPSISCEKDKIQKFIDGLTKLTLINILRMEEEEDDGFEMPSVWQ